MMSRAYTKTNQSVSEIKPKTTQSPENEFQFGLM